MGFMKRRMMEEQERGWQSAGDRFICDRCVQDDALKDLIREQLIETECDFCGRSEPEPISAELDEVIAAVDQAIKTAYNDPIEELFWDGREGGYQGVVLDTPDVFDEVGWPSHRADVNEAILVVFDHDWCEREYARLREHERLTFDWQEFVDVTKHRARYFFLVLDEDDDEWEPGTPVRRGIEILKVIGDLIDQLALTRQITEADRFVRVRSHSSGAIETAQDLGTARPDKAASNRMSPAGIGMFYAASELETALAETVDPWDAQHKDVSAGRFVFTKSVTLIDLSSLPHLPSIYDAKKQSQRSAIRFLRGFRDDISRPVERNGQELTDYVPTQVVTEFFRYIFLTDQGVRAQGIVYPSAQHAGGECSVLFIERTDCVAPGDEDPNRLQLRLADATRVSFEVDGSVKSETPIQVRALGTGGRGGAPAFKVDAAEMPPID